MQFYENCIWGLPLRGRAPESTRQWRMMYCLLRLCSQALTTVFYIKKCDGKAGSDLGMCNSTYWGSPLEAEPLKTQISEKTMYCWLRLCSRAFTTVFYINSAIRKLGTILQCAILLELHIGALPYRESPSKHTSVKKWCSVQLDCALKRWGQFSAWKNALNISRLSEKLDFAANIKN